MSSSTASSSFDDLPAVSSFHETREIQTSISPSKLVSLLVQRLTDAGQVNKSSHPTLVTECFVRGKRWFVTTVTEDGSAHIVLSENRSYIDKETTSTTGLMQEIYRDIHEMSAEGLVENAEFIQSESNPVRHSSLGLSIKAKYHSISQDVNRTIEHALHCIQYRVPGNWEASRAAVLGQLKPAIEAELKALANGPDHLGRITSLAERELRQRLRPAGVFCEHGGMLFSILAHSRSFQHASSVMDEDDWEHFMTLLNSEAPHIEMFAKSRRLRWETRIHGHVFYSRDLAEVEAHPGHLVVPADHPHNWYLPNGGAPRRMLLRGREQVHIDESIYDASTFISTRRPPEWPTTVPFPSDPTRILDPATQTCRLCDTLGCTRCSARDLLHPLIELVEFAGKGRGVRALQAIPAGSFLAEYTGEFRPVFDWACDAYTLGFHPRGFAHDVAALHPTFKGNWTRYMNHSCNPLTVFRCISLGGRTCMTVYARRHIVAFEEITTDYGDRYWRGRDEACRCGEVLCKWSAP
ncbi:MAG: hypothetical protein M1833_006310 [Piccolia ochrophora]|nr:MAG: hypothetical protein M1833_006310 [Piccolia ochrophora]